MTEFPVESQAIAPATMPQTRPIYWSVRREIWENRSVYVAPLVVAAFFMFGFMLSTIGMPHRRQATLMEPAMAKQRAIVAQPYDAAAAFLIVTAIVVGFFYCLDALHGERRDRTILFWKSMPVSDRTTVLAKASIPLVFLPVISFGIILCMQFAMLLWSSIVLLPSGLAATTWTRYNLLEQAIIQLYAIVALELWHAPIYGWLLLVSSWAKRATFLWAVLPFFAISILEKIAFNTEYFAKFIGYRFIGHVGLAFAPHAGNQINSLSQITPGRFLASPGLWLGLIVAALFLTAAVRLRRNREPI